MAHVRCREWCRLSPGVRFEYGSAYVEHVYLMSVTFDVSKLNGWLKAEPCPSTES